VLSRLLKRYLRSCLQLRKPLVRHQDSGNYRLMTVRLKQQQAMP